MLTHGWIAFQHRRLYKSKNILTSRKVKVSEVVNTHVQAIIALEIVYGSNTQRIHEFYEKLLTQVETMGKLNIIDHRRVRETHTG